MLNLYRHKLINKGCDQISLSRHFIARVLRFNDKFVTGSDSNKLPSDDIIIINTYVRGLLLKLLRLPLKEIV